MPEHPPRNAGTWMCRSSEKVATAGEVLDTDAPTSRHSETWKSRDSSRCRYWHSRQRPHRSCDGHQARETKVIALCVTLRYPVGQLTFPGLHQQGVTLHPLLQHGN